MTACRQNDSLAVHLVNLTNAMAMKGAVREFVPVGPMTVTIRLPVGARTRELSDGSARSAFRRSGLRAAQEGSECGADGDEMSAYARQEGRGAFGVSHHQELDRRTSVRVE